MTTSDVKMFPHQLEGVEFLAKRKKAILADEMGLGKTRQAIVAAHDENPASILIVCPATLKINWKREILSVYPDADVGILSTTEDPVVSQWMIVNYDILEKRLDFIESVIENGTVKTLILDEAHYIKGKSIRATIVTGGRIKRKNDGAMMQFDGIADKMERVYLLTGTPLMNRPIELFNLLKAIGHELGRNRSYFARRYCGAFLRVIQRRDGKTIRYLDESGASNLQELSERIRWYMLRRKKKDVLNLPEKIISVMSCELSKEWEKAYDNAWDNYLTFLDENPDPDKNIQNIILARQLVEFQKLKQILSISKLDRINADIRNAVEQGEKVIVFSQYTQTIEWLHKMLGEDDPIRSVVLTGSTDMHERQRAVDQFQNDPNTKVFISNIKAGGVGITLTEASIVMFADMEWSPEIHAQAEDRAHRIGQTGTVNVYYYIAEHTIDEDIVAILNQKKDVMNRILEGKEMEKGESMQAAFIRIMEKRTGRKLPTGTVDEDV